MLGGNCAFSKDITVENVERTKPFNIKQRLADNILFLATAEQDLQEISAVTLEKPDESAGS